MASACAPCAFGAASSTLLSYPGQVQQLTVTFNPLILNINGVNVTSGSYQGYPTVTGSNVFGQGKPLLWTTSGSVLTYPTTYVQYLEFTGAVATAAQCAETLAPKTLTLPTSPGAPAFIYPLNPQNQPPSDLLPSLEVVPGLTSLVGANALATCDLAIPGVTQAPVTRAAFVPAASSASARSFTVMMLAVNSSSPSIPASVSAPVTLSNPADSSSSTSPGTPAQDQSTSPTLSSSSTPSSPMTPSPPTTSSPSSSPTSSSSMSSSSSTSSSTSSVSTTTTLTVTVSSPTTLSSTVPGLSSTITVTPPPVTSPSSTTPVSGNPHQAVTSITVTSGDTIYFPNPSSSITLSPSSTSVPALPDTLSSSSSSSNTPSLATTSSITSTTLMFTNSSSSSILTSPPATPTLPPQTPNSTLITPTITVIPSNNGRKSAQSTTPLLWLTTGASLLMAWMLI